MDIANPTFLHFTQRETYVKLPFPRSYGFWRAVRKPKPK